MKFKCKDCYNCDKEYKKCFITDKTIDLELDIECNNSIIDNINVRWEKGVEYRKDSKEIARFIADIDYNNGDYFCLKFGGDGDNGEQLLYLLDIYFEAKDKDLT